MCVWRGVLHFPSVTYCDVLWRTVPSVRLLGCRYTWCEPPAAYPSQINLLVVNSTAVAVNFVTADQGART